MHENLKNLEKLSETIFCQCLWKVEPDFQMTVQPCDHENFWQSPKYYEKRIYGDFILLQESSRLKWCDFENYGGVCVCEEGGGG